MRIVPTFINIIATYYYIFSEPTIDLEKNQIMFKAKKSDSQEKA